MGEQIDWETGEYGDNGSISYRAARSAQAAHLARRSMEMGVGETGLYYALEKALHQIPEWVKADQEGHRGIKYASLKDILKTVRPHLMANGILVLQGMERSYSVDEGGGNKGRIFPVHTDLIHVPTGSVRRTMVEIPVGQLNAQSAGSALTYGRRYSLLAALGLASDEADDDGNRAMPVNLAGKHQESPELSTLKDEMTKCENSADLNKLVQDGKFTRRVEKLSEEERGLLRAHYSARMGELE